MSVTNRGRKRQAPTESSNPSEKNDNLSADEGMSVPGTATYDGTLSQISSGKRRRKKFTPQRRDEVAKVRKIGACHDCRNRKVKCSHALQGAGAHFNPATTSKPSSEPDPFEPSIPYPSAILEDNLPQDISLNDGSELIDRVPPSTGRQERLGPFLDGLNHIITDGFAGNQAKNISYPSGWGQNSEWVVNATTPTNNQQYSQPSSITSYLTPSFSNNARPSSFTPATSTVDVHSFSYGVGQYRCSVEGCRDLTIFQNELHLRQHQEINHADQFPLQVNFACTAPECLGKRYVTLDRLRMHITCNHPEAFENPEQLPTSYFSDRQFQPNSWAQTDDFIDWQSYMAGREDNQGSKVTEEIGSFITTTPRRPESHREMHCQMVQPEASMQRSLSPMQRQLPARADGNPTQRFESRSKMLSSNYGFGFTNANSGGSPPNRAPRRRHTEQRMGNFPAQHEMPQGGMHGRNSPAPSLSGEFAQHMHISNMPDTYQTPENILGDDPGLALQSIQSGVLATEKGAPLPLAVTFDGDWALENQPNMATEKQDQDSYHNIRFEAMNDYFPVYNNSLNLEGAPWSGERLSAPLQQENNFGGRRAPSSDANVPGGSFSANSGSLMGFSMLPNTAKQPTITLDDGTILHRSRNTGPIAAPITFGSNPMSPQRNSLPQLVRSNFSSSGTNDSFINPGAEMKLLRNSLGEDDWGDAASLAFFNDPNNMDVVMDPPSACNKYNPDYTNINNGE